MDLNMPVMGGLDAIKLHRFASGGRDVPPFVALTADATAETRRAGEDAGIDAYLVKPVDVDELLPLVERLTRAVPARRAPRRPRARRSRRRPRPRRRCSIRCCSAACASSTSRTTSSPS